MRLRRDLIACFEACQEELLRFLGSRIGCPERARDVAQETYLRLAAVPGDVEISNARAYVFRVAANLATDAARSESRWRARFAAEDAGATVADPAPGPERTLLGRRRLQALQAALAELSPKARAAFVLNRYDGLTHAEIAEHLGVSKSMVAKYVSQALRHCRNRLMAYDAADSGDEGCK